MGLIDDYLSSPPFIRCQNCGDAWISFHDHSLKLVHTLHNHFTHTHTHMNLARKHNTRSTQQRTFKNIAVTANCSTRCQYKPKTHTHAQTPQWTQVTHKVDTYVQHSNHSTHSKSDKTRRRTTHESIRTTVHSAHTVHMNTVHTVHSSKLPRSTPQVHWECKSNVKIIDSLHEHYVSLARKEQGKYDHFVLEQFSTGQWNHSWSLRGSKEKVIKYSR